MPVFGHVKDEMHDFERHSRPMEPYESLWHKESGPLALLAPIAEGIGAAGAGEAAAAGAGEAAGAVGGEAAAGGGLGQQVNQVSSLMNGAMGGQPSQAQQPEEEQPEEQPVTASVIEALFSHYETPASNPDVGVKHDDPEDVDQKEFNDQDKSPKNPKNPETGEPGGVTTGEDNAVSHDTAFKHDGEGSKDKDGEGGETFAPDSPGLERLQMLLPLLLHFFNSDESGANDPMIKGLHEMLEQEHPGYLNKGGTPQDAEVLIQTISPHHHKAVVENAGQTGVGPEPAKIGIEGMQLNTADQQMAAIQLQQMMQAQQSGVGSPFAQQATPQQAPRAANHQGPEKREQIQAVQQVLQQRGMEELVDLVPTEPNNPIFVEILSEIQGTPNVPPAVPPQEQTPPPQPPPPPGAGAEGPPPGAGGPAGPPGAGGNIQPMASVHDAALFYSAPLTAPDDAFFVPAPESGTSPCGCENSYCPTHGGTDQHGRPHSDRCPNPADPSYRMYGVGIVCPECGERMAQEAPEYMAPPHGTMGLDVHAHVLAADNVAPVCPKCGGHTTGMMGDDGNHAQCSACKHGQNGEWELEGVNDTSSGDTSIVSRVAGPVTSPAPANDDPSAQEAPQELGKPDFGQPRQDKGLTWATKDGEPLQPGKSYIMHAEGIPIPDMIKIMRVKPDGLEVNIVGGLGEEVDPTGGFTENISREEMISEGLSFDPLPMNADDHNNEPPPGHAAPGLPPVEQTTDEYDNSYQGVQSSVNNDLCPKCGHEERTSSMIDATNTEHECYRCGNHWITKEADAGLRREGENWVNPAADWLNEDDSWSDTDRMRMMQASKSAGSRNIRDIQQDSRSLEIKEHLDKQAALRKEGGRYFSPLEQRGLIDEDGVARNSDLLELEGTHYKSSTEANKLDPDRVPMEHILFGL